LAKLFFYLRPNRDPQQLAASLGQRPKFLRIHRTPLPSSPLLSEEQKLTGISFRYRRNGRLSKICRPKVAGGAGRVIPSLAGPDQRDAPPERGKARDGTKMRTTHVARF
jgi:hypothetical protein